MPDTDLVVEMLDIRKEFPGIVANDGITLCLRKAKFTRCSAKTAPASRR